MKELRRVYRVNGIVSYFGDKEPDPIYLGSLNILVQKGHLSLFTDYSINFKVKVRVI
jgi:hypothetical protein